jgi:penicillin-binding protein 1C
VPANSHFDLLTPHNLRVNWMAPANNVWTATANPPAEWRSELVRLPPAQEFYFRRVHAEYRPLPAMRADCNATRYRKAAPALALLLPGPELEGADPAGARRAARTARFSSGFPPPEATVYWHLDGQYLGETHTFHQQSLDIDPASTY